MVAVPTLDLERSLVGSHSWVISCDEVGRGALAGPVLVGAAFFRLDDLPTEIPEGLRDSKLIPEAKRHDVAEHAAAWVHASALGRAEASEIDRFGIIAALGMAAMRAIDGLGFLSLNPGDGLVLLDGNHDYISPAGGWAYTVRPVIKGDRDCASASAASVLAKVARDDEMTALHAEEPVYGWDRNKGYGSEAHRAAIAEHGISRHHRASWTLTSDTLF